MEGPGGGPGRGGGGLRTGQWERGAPGPSCRDWRGLGRGRGAGARKPSPRQKEAQGREQRPKTETPPESGRKVDGETIGEAIALSWHHDRGREEEEGGGGRV